MVTAVDANEATIKLEHLNAASRDIDGTAIVSLTDAQTEAAVRQALFSKKRHFFGLTFVSIKLLLDLIELGDVIEVSSSRLRLSNHRMLINSIDEDLMNGTTQLRLWV